MEYRKWQWVEFDFIPRDRKQDFRPESFRPKEHDLSDIKLIRQVGTEQDWYLRKEACLKNVYTNMTRLIEDSKNPHNVSLASFTPSKIRRLIVEDDDREWKPQWLEQLKQVDLFTTSNSNQTEPRIPIDKIPYKFKYHFEDDEGRESTMTIEDWEIGALYRNCLSAAEGDENKAINKVREKYENEFLETKDITLFLGTTLDHHRKRHNNPFTIIGIFYPPKSNQRSLL